MKSERNKLWMLLLAVVVLSAVVVFWRVYSRERVTRVTPQNAAELYGMTPEVIDKALRASAARYDWDASRKNLLAIGRTLQAYRLSQGIKPVNEWKSKADTGLRSTSKFLGLIPQDQLWVDGRTAQSSKQVASATYLTQYVSYFDGVESVLTDAELAEWLRRGEKIPVLMDSAMYAPGQLIRAKKPVPVLILRLDGTVEEILFQNFPHNDPRNKKIYLEW